MVFMAYLQIGMRQIAVGAAGLVSVGTRALRTGMRVPTDRRPQFFTNRHYAAFV